MPNVGDTIWSNYQGLIHKLAEIMPTIVKKIVEFRPHIRMEQYSFDS